MRGERGNRWRKIRLSPDCSWIIDGRHVQVERRGPGLTEDEEDVIEAIVARFAPRAVPAGLGRTKLRRDDLAVRLYLTRRIGELGAIRQGKAIGMPHDTASDLIVLGRRLVEEARERGEFDDLI